MSLRARLTIAIMLVLLITLSALGVLVIRSTRDTLTAQVDQQIMASSNQPRDGGGGGDDGDGPGPKPTPKNSGSSTDSPGKNGDDASSQPTSASPEETAYSSPSSYSDAYEEFPRERVVGHFVYSANGLLIVDEPCGYSYNPTAPPQLPEIPSADIQQMVNKIVTTPAIDDSTDYRVLVQISENGNYTVSASTLDRVDAAVRDLTRIFLILGALALGASTFAAWYIIQRGLKPVDQMVDTAAAIAGGDLTSRVPEADNHTELGKLGTALNEMLIQIETNIEARTRSEERLRRFVGDAAHELRTPLTSVRGYAELYRQGVIREEENIETAMSRIEAEGGRMARLIDDMLLLARLDQQRGLEKMPVDLVTLARESSDDFQVIAPDHPLMVSFIDSAPMLGDPLRLKQVVDNLLANARVHTPPGTQVGIDIHQVANQIVMVVWDNGPGMSEEAKEKIFERFWRADPARSRQSGGSGLGMAIVASIVDGHGGSIDVASERDRGTTFTVVLPLEETPSHQT